MDADVVSHSPPDEDSRAEKAAPASTATRVWRRSRPYLLGLLSSLVVIGLWQLIVTAHLVNSLFLPPPSDVVRALVHMFADGSIWRDLAISGQEFAIGLGISVVVGTTLGVLTGWYKVLRELLNPIVIALNGIPHIALVPLLILIYGIGVTSKVAVVILGCVTVMLMNTETGVTNVDPQLKRMARSFGANDRQMLQTVVLPSVVPYFMSGLRISIGRAIVAVVVGEIFAARAGIGHVLINASDAFNMPVMYASLIVLMVIGIILTQGAAWAERRLQGWRE